MPHGAPETRLTPGNPSKSEAVASGKTPEEPYMVMNSPKGSAASIPELVGSNVNPFVVEEFGGIVGDVRGSKELVRRVRSAP